MVPRPPFPGMNPYWETPNFWPEVIVLEAPSTSLETYASDDFAAGYIGYYLCNGAVMMQEFGDSQADLAAKQAL
jgi:agmatine deiminase